MTISQTETETATATCRVLVICTDGVTRNERWPVRADGSILAGLQEAVGGLVDVVSLTDQVDLWVNDEGLYVCEPNPFATLVASGFGRWTQPYLGTAVFTGGVDGEGRTLSLGDEVVEALLGVVARAQGDPELVARMTAAAEQFLRRYR